MRYVAPRDVADVANLQVRYVAANEGGQTAPGRVEITVVPAERRNQPPEPPQLEGRAVAGDSVTLRLPGVGVDPDGDAVTLLGIGSAPELGRIVRFGADSIEYQAYPGSGGTDEFDYVVVDAGGETATGTARVAVVPGGRAAAAAGRRRHRRRRAGSHRHRRRPGQRPRGGRRPRHRRAGRRASPAYACRARPGRSWSTHPSAPTGGPSRSSTG